VAETSPTDDISREKHRIRMQPGRAAMLPMITHCILAPPACNGLEILDGPYRDFSNVEVFAQEMRAGARSRRRRQDPEFGGGGGGGVHRDRSPAMRSSRRPPTVAQARKIIAAFRTAGKCRARRYQLDGGWWEGLHATWRNVPSRLRIAIAEKSLKLIGRPPLRVAMVLAGGLLAVPQWRKTRIRRFPSTGDGHRCRLPFTIG